MANTMELVTKYLPLLDEVYRVTAKSAVLEADPSLVQATEEAKTVKINKLEMDGLGDYSRQTGYSTGNIISTWEYWTFQNDRGRRFNLDKMDNLESLGLTFLNMAGQFMKQKVIPEKDAYTFAAIAGADGVTATSENLTKDNIKTAIDRDVTALGEAEVDEGNLLLFITPTQKTNLENALNRTLPSGETAYGQKLNYYNEIPIITVPQTRFYDAIDLLDGKSSGETEGGYRKHVVTGASGDVAGKNINYILMDKNAAVSIAKNEVAQIIEPANNQLHDGWTFSFRFYYDVFTFENKRSGIRVSKVGS
jgi:hypothetical protein